MSGAGCCRRLQTSTQHRGQRSTPWHKWCVSPIQLRLAGHFSMATQGGKKERKSQSYKQENQNGRNRVAGRKVKLPLSHQLRQRVCATETQAESHRRSLPARSAGWRQRAASTGQTASRPTASPQLSQPGKFRRCQGDRANQSGGACINNSLLL